eukprot:6179301-Pleurochrysis_carterae.AAC.3
MAICDTARATGGRQGVQTAPGGKKRYVQMLPVSSRALSSRGMHRCVRLLGARGQRARRLKAARGVGLKDS